MSSPTTDQAGKVKNNSGDKKYFVITPRIVWALSRSPHDLALWLVIKDIAGEGGECEMTTEELAALAMMSTGKAHDSRQYLISVGLLHGELEKNLESANRRWTLVVPDLWESNIKISTKLVRLKDRVKYKKNQLIELKKAHSPGERDSRSWDERPHTPGERPPTPGERGGSPRESPPYKKNQRRRTKEEPKNIDANDSISFIPEDDSDATAASIAWWWRNVICLLYEKMELHYPGELGENKISKQLITEIKKIGFARATCAAQRALCDKWVRNTGHGRDAVLYKLVQHAPAQEEIDGYGFTWKAKTLQADLVALAMGEYQGERRVEPEPEQDVVQSNISDEDLPF
jgi:hypothetical protein